MTRLARREPRIAAKITFSSGCCHFFHPPFLILAIPNHPAKFESASFRDDDRFILADDPRFRISAGEKVFESLSRHVELIVVRAGINRFHLLFDYYGGLKFAEGVANSNSCQRMFHAFAVSRLLFKLQLSIIFRRTFYIVLYRKLAKVRLIDVAFSKFFNFNT